MFAVATILSLIAGAAAQMSVTVGPGGQFFFMPPNITATNGTVVTFDFSGVPGNHSVTQSSFATPCQPLSGGFDSGWILNLNQGASATWNLTITNDSVPIWFYCKQLAPSPHCTSGMVGSINAPADGQFSFAAYQAAAEKESGTPGQAEGALVGVGASASAPPSPLTGSVTGFSNPTGAAAAASGSGSGSASGSGAASTATAPASGSSSGAAPASSSSSAGTMAANGAFAFVAALLGITLL